MVEPTLVEALGVGAVTRWGSSSGGACLRNTWSSAAVVGP